MCSMHAVARFIPSNYRIIEILIRTNEFDRTLRYKNLWKKTAIRDITSLMFNLSLSLYASLTLQISVAIA